MRPRAIHRNPIFCVLPPYVLERIISNGSPKQSSKASAILDEDRTFRFERLARTLDLFSSTAVEERLHEVFAVPWWATPLQFNKERCIYDAEGRRRLPGTEVRCEGEPPTLDGAVDEAYDGFGATFDLFFDIYERNSIDDRGMRLQGSVHYGQDYANAFWDGRRMVFGDGDNDLFKRFTTLDIIGHELAHGVTEHEAGLIYAGEPGALNESFSDVFGSLVKQRQNGDSAVAADWLIGEGIFTAKVNGQALRSMAAPGTAYDDPVLGKDPQPGHMRDYVRTHEDNGGVHINSGIPNRAFYLAAVNIGGYAWEKAGLVWYETLAGSPEEALSAGRRRQFGKLRRRFMGFRTFAVMTILTATRLYGWNDTVSQAIREAWREVGVLR